LPAEAEVALNQHTYGEPATDRRELPTGRPYSAFEAEALHAGAAADIPFLYRTGLGALECRKDVLLLDVEAVDIVEIAIPSFSHHRQTAVEC
jgi:hypothetical protein